MGNGDETIGGAAVCVMAIMMGLACNKGPTGPTEKGLAFTRIGARFQVCGIRRGGGIDIAVKTTEHRRCSHLYKKGDFPSQYGLDGEFLQLA